MPETAKEKLSGSVQTENKVPGIMMRRWIDRCGITSNPISPSGVQSRMGFKADVRFLLLLTVVIVCLWLPRWAGPLDLRWDGAVYYVLGTSIAEGKGYRLLHEPGEIEANQYPPLLPLLAAVTQTALGTSDPVVVGRWLKLFHFTFLAFLGIAAYFMLKVFVPRWLAFAGSLAFLLNVQTTFHSNLFFAEIPFGLLTVLFFLCNRQSNSLVHQVSAAVLAVMAFLLRTAGIALFAAWIAESLVRKQFRTAAFRMLISAIPVLGWTAYVFHVERSPSYTTPAYPYQRAPYLNHNVSYAENLSLADSYSHDTTKATVRQLAERFWKNFRWMGITLGEVVSESREYWGYHIQFRNQRNPILNAIVQRLHYTPLILLGGLILVGMVVLLRQGEIFVPAYILFSALILCATPWPEQFRRYLVPVAPFLLVSLFACLLGVRNAMGAFWPKLARIGAPMALMGVLALIFGSELNSLYSMHRYHLDRVSSETYEGKRVDYRLFYYPPQSEALDRALDWLKDRAKPEDVIATSMPYWAYLRKGLKAVRPPLESNRERTQALLDSVPVAYVVLSPATDGKTINNYFLPFVQGNPQAWKMVHMDERGFVRIYGRVRSENPEKQMK